MKKNGLFWLAPSEATRYAYAYKNTSLAGFDRRPCAACGREIATALYTAPAPHLVLEGGTSFPDFLQFCDAGERLFLVSERALELFDTHGISGYSGYTPVTAEPEQRIPGNNAIPRYFRLDICGRIGLDLAAMKLKKKNICPVCGQFDWNRQRLYPLLADISTWDGSDLCSLTEFPGHWLCTQAVRKLIHDNKLTGFSFQPAAPSKDTIP